MDEVYGPEKSTKDIYESRVNELVQWSLEGRTSMLLAYGQTGSGKTFTVTGLEKLLVGKLMECELSGGKEMHVCIFEVLGSSVYGKFPAVDGIFVQVLMFLQIYSTKDNQSMLWKMPLVQCNSPVSRKRIPRMQANS